MKTAVSLDTVRKDVDKAIKRCHPITVTYIREDGTETIRTIEPYETFESKAGFTIIKAMDRDTGKSKSWRLDRILRYTVHRTSFLVEREEVKTTKPSVRSTLRFSAEILYEVDGEECATVFRNLQATNTEHAEWIARGRIEERNDGQVKINGIEVWGQ